jgi:hypothetical protein
MLLKNVMRDFFYIFTGTMLGAAIFLTFFKVTMINTALLRQIFLVSLVETLFSLIFYSRNELSKRSLIFRKIIHFLLVLGVLLGAAYFFQWFNFASFKLLLYFGIIIVFVYIIIFLVIYFFNYSQVKRLNQKLSEYQQKGDDSLE